MQNRLYVTNLSASATLASIRTCFSACGEVTDVQFVAERQAYRETATAYVTMATAAIADQAVRSLHGSLLEGRSLVVSLAFERGSDREGGGRKGKATPAPVAIAQQYRERQNMTYELVCEGVPLTLKMFFPPEVGGGDWRVEAKTNQGGDVSVEKAAATRLLALQAVAEAWPGLRSDPAPPSFDWTAVTVALKTVRAL